MKEYKIWIVVEEKNTETDEYKDVYQIAYITKTYKTEEEAIQVAKAI